MKRSILLTVLILSLDIYQIEANKNEFKLQLDRIVAKFPSPEIAEGNMTSRIYNRTNPAVTSAFVKMKLKINYEDFKLGIKAYQFLSNTYRLTAVQFSYDICNILSVTEGAIVDALDEFTQDSNVPRKCPIEPGDYYLNDGHVMLNLDKYGIKIPQNFRGKWKVVLTITHEKLYKVAAIYDIYGTLSLVPKW